MSSPPVIVQKSRRTAMELRACGDHIKIVSTKMNGQGQLMQTGSGLSVPCHAVDATIAALVSLRNQLRTEGDGK